eukprot:GILI01012095.1.p1 GENE.GILI01012095.1~~GILI01012095.1.p1  ORF type:complete len:358 (-),score=44.04 GILI01012095.1:502-1575(-)
MPEENSISLTLSHIARPSGHLDTTSARYKKLTEFRGWSYFSFACLGLAIVLTPVALFKSSDSYGTSEISITYWGTTVTQTDSDGYSESQTIKTSDLACSTAKERITAASAMSIIAFGLFLFASLFALLTSGRVQLSYFKDKMESVTYYTPFIVAGTWIAMLVSWALMVAYLNNTDWCSNSTSQKKSLLSTGYTFGPGLGLNIATWVLLTVLEIVHVYLVHTKWIPHGAANFEANAAEAMMVMSPTSKDSASPANGVIAQMPPHAVAAVAAGAPFVYNLPPSVVIAPGQQPVYVIYQPAGMAPPPGYVAAISNQLPPGYVPSPYIPQTQQYYLPQPQQQSMQPVPPSTFEEPAKEELR